MLAHLLVTGGPNKGQVISLPVGQPLILGRGRKSASPLLDPHVSRQHCQVLSNGQAVVVNDLNSVGGTFCNGTRVTTSELKPGDVVRIGETTLVLQVGDLADQATLAPERSVPPPLGGPSGTLHAVAPAAIEPPRIQTQKTAVRPVSRPVLGEQQPPLAPKSEVMKLRPTAPPPAAPAPPARPALPAPPPAPKTGRAPAARSPAPAPKPEAAHPAALPAGRLGELAGKTLGHYRIEKVVAKGQSGLVFKGHDFKHNRAVALKVLWPEFARHEEEIRRFIRSMRTMMPLRHPNLVGLFGAGKKGDYCYVVMEFVEGESLHQVIQRIGSAGMLDWRHAFRIGVHLARALEFAHAQNVLHRNITPRNVLIRTADRMTMLGDLMLAARLEGSLAEQITKPGELLGDIRFMSPERTEGTEDLDHRSDLYSLGALLYTLLTGQAPFEGYTVVETVMAIRQKKPELPKKFQLSIPTRFQDTVLTLLAKRPETRFQTAKALLEDLAKIAKYLDVRV